MRTSSIIPSLPWWRGYLSRIFSSRTSGWWWVKTLNCCQTLGGRVCPSRASVTRLKHPWRHIEHISAQILTWLCIKPGLENKTIILFVFPAVFPLSRRKVNWGYGFGSDGRLWCYLRTSRRSGPAVHGYGLANQSWGLRATGARKVRVEVISHFQ